MSPITARASDHDEPLERAANVAQRWWGSCNGMRLEAVAAHSNFNHVYACYVAGECYYVKVALESPKALKALRLPAQRIVSEAEALRRVGYYTAAVAVPRVHYLDVDACTLVMSDVGVGRAQLSGRLPSNYGAWLTVAEPLGRGLAELHAASRGGSALHSEELDRSVRAFVYERLLEPGLRTLTGELGKPILAEMSRSRECLIHSDVWPKNVLVGESRPALLDFEGAMPGDPAFDLASVLAAQLLPAADSLIPANVWWSTAQQTLAAYRLGLNDARWFSVIEERLVRYMAVFLACRARGPFPFALSPGALTLLKALIAEIVAAEITGLEELTSRLASLVHEQEHG